MNDLMGPLRKVLRIDSAWDTGNTWTLAHLECGHIAKLNPIRSYQIEEDLRCFDCGEELA